MALDPYAPCPGGTGKKVKFCCADLTQELAKAQQMLDGEQTTACLEYVKKLQEKHPGRACLQSIRIPLEMQVNGDEAAVPHVDSFIKSHPTNPVALAEKAVSVGLSNDPLEGLAWIQQALEACDESMPTPVYEAIGQLAIMLFSSHRYLPARALWQLQLGISQGKDERPMSVLLRLEAAPFVPVLLKDMPPLVNAPSGVTWEAKFTQGLDAARRGLWKKAEQLWSSLESDAAQASALWRNLATVRGFLGDNVGAAAALRKFAALKDTSIDDAVDAEAMAQVLLKDVDELQVEEISVSYSLTNDELAQEKFASDKRFERIPFDASPWTSQNEPPPRAVFSLLDRPAVATGANITRDQIPVQLGELLFFGKQTDRDARLELILYRTDLPAAQAILTEVLGDLLQPAGEETVVRKINHVEHALSWHWRLPDDTPEDQRVAMSLEQRRDMVLKRWPGIPQALFGGRTPRLAASEPEYRNRVLAAIWLLQLSDSSLEPDTYHELRQSLGLPEMADIEVTPDLEIKNLPLARLARLRVESLSDQQLQEAFNRAVVANFAVALRRLAPEIIRRPDVEVEKYKLLAYQAWVPLLTTSEVALQRIDEARKLAESVKQSSAMWDLMELSYRIRRDEAEKVLQLIRHIQTQHAREPGVAETLVQLLMEAGLIGPDGRFVAASQPAAAEAGKLWTPDSPQTPAAATAKAGGETKSSLWLPE